MITTFSLLFSVSAFTVICCMIATIRIKANYYPWLRAMLAFALVEIICHLVIINAHSFLTIKICYGIFYIFINPMLFALLEFSRRFTKYKTKYPALIWVMYGLLAVDIISLLFNFYFNHEYMLTRIDYLWGTETIRIYKIKMAPMFYLHLALAYAISALVVVLHFARVVRSPKMYRTPYVTILVFFLLTILGDATYVFLSVPIDFSIVFYAVSAVCISFYAGQVAPLQVLNRQFEAMIAKMNDAVQLFDIDGEAIFRNNAMDFLIEKYKKIGLNPEGPFKALQSGDTYRKLKNLPDREFDESVTKDGKIYTFHISTRCLRDEKNNFLGAFLIVHDKTKEVEKLNNDLYIASHDTLTGLLNREGFQERAKQLLMNEPDEEYILVASDIDNFKMVNDNFGRETGDDFLRRSAKHLSEVTKDYEVYARLNGDHFVLLMKKKDFKEEVFILHSAQVAYLTEDVMYPINFHFGIYEIEDVSMSVSTMIDRAYIALETIKGNLQQKFAYYNKDLRESILREQQLIGEFPIALASEQFEMYLQPQVTTENLVHGAEALVRWNHITEGVLPPHEFVSLFEKRGLITQLDLYIWDQAARKLADWKSRGLKDYYISVNISPIDFLYVDIYKTFTELVSRYEIDPKNLKLEITESAVMLNLDMQIELINRLRAYGFLIEMDDFGSGYSSLNLLKDISFDILKIDMNFLAETDNPERSIAILHSIIKLSKRLNMPVITEGVETKEQVEFLKEMGTDYYQGFYFDKPLTVSDFEAKYIKD